MKVGEERVGDVKLEPGANEEIGRAGAGANPPLADRDRLEGANDGGADGDHPPPIAARAIDGRGRRFGHHEVLEVEVMLLDRLGANRREGPVADLEAHAREMRPASLDRREGVVAQVEPRRRRRDRHPPFGEDGLVALLVERGEGNLLLARPPPRAPNIGRDWNVSEALQGNQRVGTQDSGAPGLGVAGDQLDRDPRIALELEPHPIPELPLAVEKNADLAPRKSFQHEPFERRSRRPLEMDPRAADPHVVHDNQVIPLQKSGELGDRGVGSRAASTIEHKESGRFPSFGGNAGDPVIRQRKVELVESHRMSVVEKEYGDGYMYPPHQS